MKRILIADDNPSILALLTHTFEHADFAVTAVSDGGAALDQLTNATFDVAVLDLMMPIYDGIQVITQARAAGNFIPMLILTAREDDISRINGLDAGADDYMDKTTSQREILARVNAMIRRAQTFTLGNLENAPAATDNTQGLVLDVANHMAFVDGVDLDLTAREFDILEYLYNHSDIVVSRERLLNRLWGTEDMMETRIVDMTISKLRKKLNNRYIKTKRGLGYQFKEDYEG
jgi:DNA-binding response OmpR family regulator